MRSACRVPADNDARSINDDDAGLELFEQPEVLKCQALIHKLPSGARRISNLLLGLPIAGAYRSLGGVLFCSGLDSPPGLVHSDD